MSNNSDVCQVQFGCSEVCQVQMVCPISRQIELALELDNVEQKIQKLQYTYKELDLIHERALLYIKTQALKDHQRLDKSITNKVDNYSLNQIRVNLENNMKRIVDGNRATNTCKKVFARGPRKGQVCGRPAWCFTQNRCIEHPLTATERADFEAKEAVRRALEEDEKKQKNQEYKQKCWEFVTEEYNKELDLIVAKNDVETAKEIKSYQEEKETIQSEITELYATKKRIIDQMNVLDALFASKAQSVVEKKRMSNNENTLQCQKDKIKIDTEKYQKSLEEFQEWMKTDIKERLKKYKKEKEEE